MPDHQPASTAPRHLAGLILLILVPICLLAAVAYALFSPRLFSASTTFKLLLPDVDAPRLRNSFEVARSQYQSRMQEPLATDVRFEQFDGPAKFRITATDTEPLRAVHSANGLTLLTRDGLWQDEAELTPRMEVLERAEMPKRPSHPDVQQIMNIGVSAGILCAVAGVTLRRKPGARRSAPRPPPAPYDY